PCLEHLFAYDNQLSNLPEPIGQLTNLQSLDLSRNRLRSLPQSMQELKALSGLLLHGNDELGIPAEILGPDPGKDSDLEDKWAKPASILDYYLRTQGKARPLNEAKLILVGRGMVGKTSLVNQLVFGKFDPKENKTEGIGITPWKVQTGG